VKDLPISLAAPVLLHGTTFAPLWESLVFAQPTFMTEMFAKANQFVVHMEILGSYKAKKG